MTESHDETTVMLHQGKACSVNIGSGGMLLLMAHAPQVQQVFEVHAPSPTGQRDGGLTLVEVRWRREISVDASNRLCFVGVKFLLSPSQLARTIHAS